MQIFHDTVTNDQFAFDDDVVAKQDNNGVYTFTAPNGQKLAAPSTLQPGAPTLSDAEKLANAQASKLQELAAAYATAMQQPQSFTTAAGVTKDYTASQANIQNLSQMLLAFNKSQATPSGFYFKSDDKTKVDMTYADLQGLAETLGSYGNTQWQHLDSLRDQVEAATTVSAVQAITW